MGQRPARDKGALIKTLLTAFGGKFSSDLGIDLSSGDSKEIFKWFLASKLFGARISSEIASRTYREFERKGILTPAEILKTGWDGLVQVLDAGGYVRYDFSTATKLLGISRDLMDKYGGDLGRLHGEATGERDLEERLKALGKGIGDVTVNIFLREMRGAWEKAAPEPSPLVTLAARHLGLLGRGKGSLRELQGIWKAYKVRGRDFADFEGALLKLGKDYCKRNRQSICPFRDICKGT